MASSTETRPDIYPDLQAIEAGVAQSKIDMQNAEQTSSTGVLTENSPTAADTAIASLESPATGKPYPEYEGIIVEDIEPDQAVLNEVALKNATIVSGSTKNPDSAETPKKVSMSLEALATGQPYQTTPEIKAAVESVSYAESEARTAGVLTQDPQMAVATSKAIDRWTVPKKAPSKAESTAYAERFPSAHDVKAAKPPQLPSLDTVIDQWRSTVTPRLAQLGVKLASDTARKRRPIEAHQNVKRHELETAVEFTRQYMNQQADPNGFNDLVHVLISKSPRIMSTKTWETEKRETQAIAKAYNHIPTAEQQPVSKKEVKSEVESAPDMFAEQRSASVKHSYKPLHRKNRLAAIKESAHAYFDKVRTFYNTSGFKASAGETTMSVHAQLIAATAPVIAEYDSWRAEREMTAKPWLIRRTRQSMDQERSKLLVEQELLVEEIESAYETQENEHISDCQGKALNEMAEFTEQLAVAQQLEDQALMAERREKQRRGVGFGIMGVSTLGALAATGAFALGGITLPGEPNTTNEAAQSPDATSSIAPSTAATPETPNITELPPVTGQTVPENPTQPSTPSKPAHVTKVDKIMQQLERNGMTRQDITINANDGLTNTIQSLGAEAGVTLTGSEAATIYEADLKPVIEAGNNAPNPVVQGVKLYKTASGDYGYGNTVERGNITKKAFRAIARGIAKAAINHLDPRK